jgi:hypothetical protein
METEKGSRKQQRPDSDRPAPRDRPTRLLPQLEEPARHPAKLVEGQRADGSWSIYCSGGPATTAKVLIALDFAHQIETFDEESITEIVRHFCNQQRADGSFAPWPHPLNRILSEEDDGAVLSATATVLAALKISRRSNLQDVAKAITKADTFVRSKGGLQKVVERGKQGDYTALLLAMAGLIPVSALPPTPLVFRLVPGSELILEQRVNLGVPFQMLTYDVIRDYIAAGRRPPHRPKLAEMAVSLINPAGSTTLPDLKTRLLTAASNLLRDGGLIASGWRSLPERVPAAFEGQRLSMLLTRYENRDGSWLYGDSGTTAMAIASLHALGADAKDRRILNGCQFLERQIKDDEFALFQTDVWATTFRVRSLLALGLAPWTEPLSRAIMWLVDNQRSGSWAFQARNSALPDTDDTAMVVATLALALKAERNHVRVDGGQGFRRGLRQRIEQALVAGRDWLLARQNDDGGWAAFQHGFPSKPPGAFMTGPPPLPKNGVLDRWDFLIDPPAELGDPATEDLTGRVLFALGHAGMAAYDPPIQRAVEFLSRMQMDSGAWWGRWVSTFLPSTCWVLRGLSAVNADLSEPWIRRGIDFLENAQNADHGWGEDLAASRDAARAGQGPTERYHTAGAVLALMDLGPAADSERLARGLIRLTELMNENPESEPLHPLVPPDSFYNMPGIDLDLAYEAWGRARAEDPANPPLRFAIPTPSAPMASRDLSDKREADELLKQGDKATDDLLADMDDKEMGALVQRLLAMDGVPTGGPDLFAGPLATIVAATGADISDDDRKEAQGFFREFGWAIAACLFCSSLPQSFAFPRGARVLAASDQLNRRPQSRIVETMQFILDVATGDKEQSRRSIGRVRLLHGVLRAMLPKLKPEIAADAVPINQQHILSTILSFSWVVVQGLRALGFSPTVAQEESWLKLWAEVGARMGLEPEHQQYLQTPADAARAMERLRQHGWGPSPEGATLAGSLVAMMQDFIPGEKLDGLPLALIRHLAGPECADLLGLPEADWTRLVLRMTTPGNRIARGIFGESPVGFVAQAGSWRLFDALTNHLRPGKGQPFRIPAELLSHWQLRHGPTFAGS